MSSPCFPQSQSPHADLTGRWPAAKLCKRSKKVMSQFAQLFPVPPKCHHISWTAAWPTRSAPNKSSPEGGHTTPHQGCKKVPALQAPHEKVHILVERCGWRTRKFTRISVCQSVCLSVCLSFCLSICMSVCLSVCLSVCVSVCLSVCLFVYKYGLQPEVFILYHLFVLRSPPPPIFGLFVFWQTFCDLQTWLNLFYCILHAFRKGRCSFLPLYGVIFCILWATLSCKHIRG